MRSLLIAARDVVLPFATSDWVDLVPNLLQGVDRIVGGLAPGVTLGDKYPGVLAAGRVARSPAPSSQSSPASLAPPTLSPVEAPPMSSEPSTGSSSAGPPGVVPDDGPTARPTRPLPRASYRQVVRTSSFEDAPPPPAAIPQIVVSRVASRAAAVEPSAPAPIVAVVPTGPAAATRSSTKRAAVEPSPPVPPVKWRRCVRCAENKKGCSPSEKADPPYSACTLCVVGGNPCVPGNGACRFVFFFAFLLTSSVSSSCSAASPSALASGTIACRCRARSEVDSPRASGYRWAGCGALAHHFKARRAHWWHTFRGAPIRPFAWVCLRSSCFPLGLACRDLRCGA
jgi:hypothetical protein